LNLKKAITIFVLGAIAVVVLFDFDWVLDCGQSNGHEVPDPAVEELYENCYAIKDDAMHRQAFGTIDNPDVQREFISANRAVIAAECRGEFLQQLISVESDTSLNLIDVHPRFW
jgi:hypothetical protein